MNWSARTRPLLFALLLSILTHFCGQHPARAAQAGSVPPPALIAAAVQGDRTGSRDKASEFLSGCPFSFQSDPAAPRATCANLLHVPQDWSFTQLQVDPFVSDYSAFFEHASVIDQSGRNGLDNIPEIGIDSAEILFYVGHGTPAWLSAIREHSVDLKTISVGEVAVRYLFALSCNLFAHGERDSSTPEGDFVHPESFSPAAFDSSKSPADPDYVANVFYTWGANYATAPSFLSPLHPHLRFACGGSSAFLGTDNPMQRFWHYRLIAHLSPADSFLAGLYDAAHHIVPLCISRGNQYQDSGLVDAEFQPKPLASTPADIGQSIFIAYPIKIASPPYLVGLTAPGPALDGVSAPIPHLATPADAPSLPVLSVKAAAAPSFPGVTFTGPAGSFGFIEGTVTLPGLDTLESHGPAKKNICVVRQQDSGALSFSWRPVAEPTAVALASLGGALLARLIDLLPKVATMSPGIAADDPAVFQINIDRAQAAQVLQANHVDESIDHAVGCVYAQQHQSYRQGDLKVEIAGEGAETLVKVCPPTALAPDTFSPSSLSDVSACRRPTVPLVSLTFSSREYNGNSAQAITRVAYDAAQQEAARLLAEQEAGGLYNPQPEVRLVYWAAPVNCLQSSMYLFYRFRFLPLKPSQDLGFPPVTLDIPAQLPPGQDLRTAAQAIKDAWVCKPQKLPNSPQ